MFKLRTTTWYNQFKKYLFTYKDGYFDLPYLSNSPAVMVESFKYMPFTKHDKNEQVIYTKNIFTDGAMYYQELEEGLWIIITEIEFKKNVSTNALYDNEPCDYYFLSHFVYNSAVDEIEVNQITIQTSGWSLYKPGTEIKAYFNKGDKGAFANFVFSKNWFERNVETTALRTDHTLRHYLDSDKGYTTWKDVVPDSQILLIQLLNMLKEHAPGSKLSIKILCLDIINKFFDNISLLTVPAKVSFSETDRRMAAKAEKIIVTALTHEFPGIEEIARQLHTSPTKLKTVFKAVYEKSIFQYYQYKQMILALTMLKQQPTTLKQIALLFGYQNPSKFSSAFKKVHGFLPSQLINN